MKAHDARRYSGYDSSAHRTESPPLIAAYQFWTLRRIFFIDQNVVEQPGDNLADRGDVLPLQRLEELARIAANRQQLLDQVGGFGGSGAFRHCRRNNKAMSKSTIRTM